MEDDETSKLRSSIDDEYAQAGVRDPKVCVTTSRDPSSRLKQFAKELKLVVPNAQRINRGNHKVRDTLSHSPMIILSVVLACISVLTSATCTTTKGSACSIPAAIVTCPYSNKTPKGGIPRASRRKWLPALSVTLVDCFVPYVCGGMWRLTRSRFQVVIVRPISLLLEKRAASSHSRPNIQWATPPFVNQPTNSNSGEPKKRRGSYDPFSAQYTHRVGSSFFCCVSSTSMYTERANQSTYSRRIGYSGYPQHSPRSSITHPPHKVHSSTMTSSQIPLATEKNGVPT